MVQHESGSGVRCRQAAPLDPILRAKPVQKNQINPKYNFLSRGLFDRIRDSGRCESGKSVGRKKRDALLKKGSIEEKTTFFAYPKRVGV